LITNGVGFSRVDSNLYNATVIAKYTAQFANYTSVSETTFLSDLNGFQLNHANDEEANIIRIGNVFYLTINDYPQYDITVYCTP
jgi:hypothetical protein